MAASFAPRPLGLEEMSGILDGVLLPDPNTLRSISWAPGTGWLLACVDPLSTREVLRSALDDRGQGLAIGLEVEFTLTRVLHAHVSPADATPPPTPPSDEAIAHGYQASLDSHHDQLDDVFTEIRLGL